jgi:hypothetical protein
MNEDIYEDLSYLENDFEFAEALQANLIARATGGDYDSRNYVLIRKKFLQNEDIKSKLPGFIKKCRDIEQFWQFIKEKFSGNGCYAERRTYIYESFQDLLEHLEEVHILNEKEFVTLYQDEKVKTIDEELNDLLLEAKERFNVPKDKQVALEKLWDAFERIKTHFGTNKRESSLKLIDAISTDFDREFIENEFKVLTKIGNGYRIRHHEKDKIQIKNPRHIEYLFLRMLALLNLCIDNIKLDNEKDTI